METCREFIRDLHAIQETNPGTLDKILIWITIKSYSDMGLNNDSLLEAFDECLHHMSTSESFLAPADTGGTLNGADKNRSNVISVLKLIDCHFKQYEHEKAWYLIYTAAAELLIRLHDKRCVKELIRNSCIDQ